MDPRCLLDHLDGGSLLGGNGGLVLAGEGLQQLFLLSGDALLSSLAGFLHLVTAGLGLVTEKIFFC